MTRALASMTGYVFAALTYVVIGLVLLIACQWVILPLVLAAFFAAAGSLPPGVVSVSRLAPAGLFMMVLAIAFLLWRRYVGRRRVAWDTLQVFADAAATGQPLAESLRVAAEDVPARRGRKMRRLADLAERKPLQAIRRVASRAGEPARHALTRTDRLDLAVHAIPRLLTRHRQRLHLRGGRGSHIAYFSAALVLVLLPLSIVLLSTLMLDFDLPAAHLAGAEDTPWLTSLFKVPGVMHVLGDPERFERSIGLILMAMPLAILALLLLASHHVRSGIVRGLAGVPLVGRWMGLADEAEAAHRLADAVEAGLPDPVAAAGFRKPTALPRRVRAAWAATSFTTPDAQATHLRFTANLSEGESLRLRVLATAAAAPLLTLLIGGVLLCISVLMFQWIAWQTMQIVNSGGMG